jgi:hypothetical protein
MQRLACLGLLVCVGAVACGRTELDLGGPDTLPVTTGAAGSSPSGAAGAMVTPTGQAGATSGTAGAATQGQGGATPGTAGAAPTGQAGAPGMTGAAGGVVNPGGPNMPTTGPLIPCGTELCQPIMQACCVRAQNGVPSATCVAATETCDGGASFSCSNTPQCGGGGDVCCVSAQTLSTTCEAPAACLLSPGVILCGSDADCPALIGNCCGQGNLKICRLRACAGGGRGPGGGGPGNGGGRPGG